jgi:hypothetical protein
LSPPEQVTVEREQDVVFRHIQFWAASLFAFTAFLENDFAAGSVMFMMTEGCIGVGDGGGFVGVADGGGVEDDEDELLEEELPLWR